MLKMFFIVSQFWHTIFFGCMLLFVGCRLSVVGCRLSVVGCQLSVVGCLFPIAYCLLPILYILSLRQQKLPQRYRFNPFVGVTTKRF
jgi:tyrosine kinase 3/solute carrier family 25 phosphate transporter 23/24/25/41